MKKGIKINVRPPADQFVDHSTEKIIEFFDWSTGQGGLISFATTAAKGLAVTVYRHDDQVRVGEGKRRLERYG